MIQQFDSSLKVEFVLDRLACVLSYNIISKVSSHSKMSKIKVVKKEHVIKSVKMKDSEVESSDEEIELDEYEQKMVDTPRYKRAKTILKNKFGHTAFKPYQYQIINNILNGKDVLAIMPTGYGKSLCFQLPPLMTDEVAIVISPLIALMADQKMILDKLGMSSCCYNSTLTQKKKKEIEESLIGGEIQIMYITPESLSTSHKLIDRIYSSVGVCMIAIDEAHCLSSYGFDFRPKYREIVKIRKILPDVPVLAVTATATEKVSKDILGVMNMKDSNLIKTSFDRPNLMIHVSRYDQNTIDKIKEIVNSSTGSSIVYCLTKKDTEDIAKKLQEGGIDARAYHAGLKKEERTKVQADFMNNEYDCITATIAFGMGINKPDIRTVIHIGCPQNIESYYQEIGRAGRDGKRADCYLFYKQNDFIIHLRFINEIKDAGYKTIRRVLMSQISQYVNASDCRRKYILQYFNQSTATQNCGMCDNCVGKKDKIGKRDELKLFQVLSTVLLIHKTKGYTFGSSTIALILKGSSSQKIKPWMKNLTYYGSMKSLSAKDINAFINKTIELGYVEDHDVGNCVRVLRCTDHGIEFGNKYEVKLNKMIAEQDNIIEELILG